MSDLDVILERLDRIENNLESGIQRLEARIDELEHEAGRAQCDHEPCDFDPETIQALRDELRYAQQERDRMERRWRRAS